MKKIYVAGPYRADNAWGVEKNIRKAEELGMELARAGFNPMIPHTMFRYFNGTLTDEFWLKATMEWLETCDAIALVKGWGHSDGAVKEYDRAIELGFQVLQSPIVRPG